MAERSPQHPILPPNLPSGLSLTQRESPDFKLLREPGHPLLTV